jgi:hypothetical protein
MTPQILAMAPVILGKSHDFANLVYQGPRVGGNAGSWHTGSGPALAMGLFFIDMQRLKSGVGQKRKRAGSKVKRSGSGSRLRCQPCISANAFASMA